MNIFITGQTTLHWGRMEFGNIGNYYITEPFFEEIRNAFPNAEIHTTFQLTSEFANRYNLVIVPKEQYFVFERDDNLETARQELKTAIDISDGLDTSKAQLTDYLREILWCNVFIDLSGDMWGDNANFLGKDRFEVGLIKDRIAQVLHKKTFMLAGSPGPFNNEKTKVLAKQVYSGFDLVTNREPISTELLLKWGFDVSKTQTHACPSFLFNPDDKNAGNQVLAEAGLRYDERPVVGMILCGWNFLKGPFDRWPREDYEYDRFMQLAEHIVNQYQVKLCLLSHSNGFVPPPDQFQMLHGRDYPIAQQLKRLLLEKKVEVYSLDGIYSPQMTKSIIGDFDMLISGRVHGAVAGLSQCVPTVIIDYGHEPKAHKLRGFARVVGQERYLVEPGDANRLCSVVDTCWEYRKEIKDELTKRMPEIRNDARSCFSEMKKLIEISG